MPDPKDISELNMDLCKPGKWKSSDSMARFRLHVKSLLATHTRMNFISRDGKSKPACVALRAIIPALCGFKPPNLRSILLIICVWLFEKMLRFHFISLLMIKVKSFDRITHNCQLRNQNLRCC